MTTRAQLLDAHEELTVALRASETWEESYKRSPRTLKRLVRAEARLQRAANEYLLGLRDRVADLVNWNEVRPKLRASDVPLESSAIFENERVLLTAAVGDDILELVVIGAQAGEDIYLRPIGITTLSDQVLQTAQTHTAELVSQVTKTTRRQIQRAIKQSIANGENAVDMTGRILQYISNPVRAEMIAQTESVNAYQGGLDVFGHESGAISSTWDALSGACKLCAPIDDVTVALGEMFVLPNGHEVQRPAAHTRCRCGRYLNYPE